MNRKPVQTEVLEIHYIRRLVVGAAAMPQRSINSIQSISLAKYITSQRVAMITL